MRNWKSLPVLCLMVVLLISVTDDAMAQRRAAKRTQIQFYHLMLTYAQRLGHLPGTIDLPPMPLPVIHRQRITGISFCE